VRPAGEQVRERGAEDGGTGTPAGVTRGTFLRRGAVAAGSVAGLGLLGAHTALGGSGADPVPIPGGFDADFNIVPKGALLHILPPIVGFEMSTITNFDGAIAAAEIQGTANNGAYNFDCDMRVMQGLYVGTDGRLRQNTFGFI
jgi:hypothetical protein